MVQPLFGIRPGESAWSHTGPAGQRLERTLHTIPRRSRTAEVDQLHNINCLQPEERDTMTP